jgi:hypothetical protein
MRRAILTILVAALVAPAATLAAGGPGGQAGQNARAACAALRTQMGPAAFAQAYATFGACVSSKAKVELQNTAAATAACRAEQADANFAATHGGKTFDQFYGSGKKGRNAFAKCVSTKAEASSQAEQQGTPNPAQACQALRLQMGVDAFALAYGTNPNHRNGFGKCVSKLASVQSSNELAAARQCRTEQADANFAAGHGGKTFDQFYGTNTDLSNAFGKCVSAKAAASLSAQEQAAASAAKACRAELTTDRAAFRTKYGTFGHCVSQKASTK